MTRSQAAPSTHRRRAGRPRGGVLRTDRARLLEAAQRAIAAIGPDVTMDQIAAEAQISKPIVYRTIGDRAALVDSLSDLLVDRIGQSIEASIDVDEDPAIGFTGALRAHFTAVDADQNLYLFVNGAGQRSAMLRARVDRAGERLVELFTAGHADPGREASASTWAYVVVGALQTVTLMWLEADPAQRRTIDDVAADVSRLLWPGIAAVVDLDNLPRS